MLIAGLGLLWLLSQKPVVKPDVWIGGSQEAQMTALYEIGA